MKQLPRLILVGAESTGKSTLADRLCEKYNVPLIQEYCRIFAEAKTEPMSEWKWTSSEFMEMAQAHIDAESEASLLTDKFLLCDNDAFAVSIWHERYMGSQLEELEILHQEHATNKQIYLLTTNDVPFVQDGYRDGEHIRHWMYDRFVEKLKEYNKEYYLLSGDYENRFKLACQILDSF